MIMDTETFPPSRFGDDYRGDSPFPVVGFYDP